MRRMLLAAIISVFAGGGGAAAARDAVDLALVLAVDVSRSVHEGEFKLQRQGYAAALTDPDVLRAIRAGLHRAIAVSYVEWSNSDQQAVVVDWTVLRDGESAATMADAILAAPRSFASR